MENTEVPIWLRQAFLIPINNDDLSYGSNKKRRYATSAAFKYTNASLGGNYHVNPLPQYTRYCDIRQPGRGRDESDRNLGEGRYYSEAHSDLAQDVIFSFGVPQFSSWTSFFTNFYDRSAALVANTGQMTTVGYNVGNTLGYIVTLPLQPFILGITATSRVLSFLTKSSPSKWFYFKPTMHAYWNAVNTIANQFAIILGLTPRIFDTDNSSLADDLNKAGLGDAKRLHEIFPSLFRADGGVDVMSLALRTQRMSDQAQKAERAALQRAASIKEQHAEIERLRGTRPTDEGSNRSARQYFLDYIQTDNNRSFMLDSSTFSSWSQLENVYEFIVASQRDGNQFVNFRVDHIGEVSESFSNQTTEVGVAQTLNAKVREGRAASYTFMGGAITEGVDQILNLATNVVAGAADSVNLSGIATLFGSAYIDVPEYWDSAIANLPSTTYTVQLNSVYGNKLSRFLGIYIPLAMLLAGVLPRSAGRSAYTSPFICQFFHRGRTMNQLGIISDMTIRRGTGHVGWSADNEMLSCEVTFTVKNLSKIMHMPIVSGFSSASWIGTLARAGAASVGEAIGGDAGLGYASALTNGAVWDEQSMFDDYMATLCSQSWADYYYVGNKLNLNITKAAQSFKSWRTPSNFMSWILNGDVARTIAAFAQTTDRL